MSNVYHMCVSNTTLGKAGCSTNPLWGNKVVKSSFFLTISCCITMTNHMNVRSMQAVVKTQQMGHESSWKPHFQSTYEKLNNLNINTVQSSKSLRNLKVAKMSAYLKNTHKHSRGLCLLNMQKQTNKGYRFRAVGFYYIATRRLPTK